MEKELDVYRILSNLPIRPHLRIADVGCGFGLFTIPLAKMVWDGKVFAIDSDDKTLEEIKNRAQKTHLGNIIISKLDNESIPLESDSVDGVVLAFTLSGFVDKQNCIREVSRILCRGGWCVLIEWMPSAKGKGIPLVKNRISSEKCGELADKVDMSVGLRRELNDLHYMLLLNK